MNGKDTLILAVRFAATSKSKRKGEGQGRRERIVAGHSILSIVNKMLHTALPSYKVSCPLSPSRFLPSSTVSLVDLQCSLCSNIVDQPVQTPCRKLACSVCIASLLRTCELDHFPCPSCKEFHEINKASFPEATDVVMNVLGDLLLTCDKPLCTEVVALKNLRKHAVSGCSHETPTFSPSKLTVGQIISRPLTSPPTTAERKAATSVVKRLISTSTDDGQPSAPCSSRNVVRLPTAGQVRTYTIKHTYMYIRIVSDHTAFLLS